jgi:NAD(P)-dependent dehydrogenase (short-subunit alcohol dehydrogenase family)
MQMRLEEKVAVITGAGSGVGRATARLFAAEGAKVVCADVSGDEDTVAAEIGDAAIAVHTDVANEDDVRNMIATAERGFGRLDVLVNNAGFGGGLAPLHEQTAEHWDRIHSVNIRAVFLGMRYGIISMLRSGGGAIVNVSSSSGLVGRKHHSVYGAAKAGVNQLTKAAALDYARANIRVNAVLPGSVWTGLVPLSKEHPEPPPGIGRPAGIPMDRWGLPQEIAAAVLFLASDEASFITGVLLPADGGYCIGFSGMGAEHTGSPSA